MRVSPVRTVSHVNQHQKIQNFKGLWGKETLIPDNSTDNKNFYDSRILHYYPYRNETKEDIENVVKENTVIDRYDPISDAYPDMSNIVNRKVIVETTLPFSKYEWFMYSNNSKELKPSDKSYITQTLKRFNLPEHIVKRNK